MRAADASRDHHAWSADPWTTKPTRYGLPLPGRPVPAHPNAAGMRAVADLVADCGRVTVMWRDDRVGRAHQGIWPNPRSRRSDLHHRAGRGDRLPRPERGGQDDDDADDPRPGPSDVGHRDHRRQALPRAGRPAAPRRRAAGRQADPSQPVGARSICAGSRRRNRIARRPGRRGARHGRADGRRGQEGRHAVARHEPAARHRRARCSAIRRCCCSTSRSTGWTPRASAGCAR